MSKRGSSKGLGAKKKQKVFEPEDAPAPKPKPTGPLGSPINEANYKAEATAALNKYFLEAQPYTHCQLTSLCQPERLLAVRDEIVGSVRATFKETDLFKVFQTGDLANMDKLEPEVAAQIPELRALRDAIYSAPFRKMVQEITGCGELTDRTDLSANVYAQGGHLLCHDDVIGTRCISFIIYLTDPEEPWEAKDGGALELYPCKDGKRGFPATTPSATLLPEWNSMVFFQVLPGVSFHSVQEVMTETNPRLSISGWYHAPAPPEGSEHFATLSMLTSKEAGAGAQFDDIPGGAAREGQGVTDADRELLGKWLNPAYLKSDAMDKIREQFVEESSIQLTHFIAPEHAKKIRAAILAADAADKVGLGRLPDYSAGEGGGWEARGPPHMQRFLAFTGAPSGDSPDAGPLLRQLQDDVFTSGAFARFLRDLTGLDVLSYRSEVQRYRPGLDYTVAHHGLLAQNDRLDAVLTFVDDAGQDNHLAWDCGEVGGFECYITAEDDDTKGDVAVYQRAKEGGEGEGKGGEEEEEEGGDLLSVQASFNTLNLVHRDTGIMRFNKYVSYRAPSSRWSVTAEYKIEDPSEDDDEEGEGGGDGAA